MEDEEQLSVPDAMIMMESATVVEMSLGRIGTVMVLVPDRYAKVEGDSPMIAKLAMATGDALAQVVRLENVKNQKRATQVIEKLKEVKPCLSEEDNSNEKND